MKLEISQEQLQYLGSLVASDLSDNLDNLNTALNEPDDMTKFALTIAGSYERLLGRGEVSLNTFELLVLADKRHKNKKGVLKEIAHNRKELERVKKDYAAMASKIDIKTYGKN